MKKSSEDQAVISNVIKSSAYYKFAPCCDDELTDIVDAFDVEKYQCGSIIVKQGDSFDRNYIVKKGIVDLFIDGEHISSLTPKNTFGNSFMMGSKSQSTFRARDECELWFLPIMNFRSISIYYKQMNLSFKTSFLKMVSQQFLMHRV